MRIEVYLKVLPGKLDFCNSSLSFSAWNVNVMIRMQQSYCDQEEKALKLRVAVQENQRIWVLMMIVPCITCLCISCFVRKIHLFSLGHCDIQINTIPESNIISFNPHNKLPR